jgi:hypothetical protein
MLITRVTAGRWAACVALLLATLFAVQVGGVLAAGPETYALPQVVAQMPTPTPFRFQTPVPAAPGSTVPSTTTTTAPRAGGFPLELAVPALAGGLAAIGGGSFLLRRRTPR